MMQQIEPVEKFRRPCRAVLNKVAEIIEYLSRMQPVAGPGIQLEETAGGIVFSSGPVEQTASRSPAQTSVVPYRYTGPFALSFNENGNIEINLNGAFLHTPAYYGLAGYSSTVSISPASDSKMIYLDITDVTAVFLTYDSGGNTSGEVGAFRIPIGHLTVEGSGAKYLTQYMYGAVAWTAQFSEVY